MKYKFTGETKTERGIVLRRIQRLSDGLVGGWVESESNLSHDGEAWVYGEAVVYGKARVFGEAQICDKAAVSTSTMIATARIDWAITATPQNMVIGCQVKPPR